MRIKSFPTFIRPYAFYAGVPCIKRKLRALKKQKPVFILMYHRVCPSPWPYLDLSVTPDLFEKQIKYITKNYHIIDFHNLARADYTKGEKKDCVIISFDDGYRDFYIYAFPILKKYKAPATVFLATGYTGTKNLIWYDKLAWILFCAGGFDSHLSDSMAHEIKNPVLNFFKARGTEKTESLNRIVSYLKNIRQDLRQKIIKDLETACKPKSIAKVKKRLMLSWDEVIFMAQNNINFGSHTVSHPVLSLISENDAKREITESKKIIEEKTQKPVMLFAYPYGKKEDYSNRTIRILKDAGFKYACTTIKGDETLNPDLPLELKRRGVPQNPYLFL